jgi:hypothetical protein
VQQIVIGGVKYQLAKAKLGREPAVFIAERARGGKVERPDGGMANGKPAPWPFRMIAPELSKAVGFYVSYESTRAWYRQYEALLEQRRAGRGQAA